MADAGERLAVAPATNAGDLNSQLSIHLDGRGWRTTLVKNNMKLAAVAVTSDRHPQYTAAYSTNNLEWKAS